MTTRVKTQPHATRGLVAGARPRAVISTDQVDSENDVVRQDGLVFRERMRVLVSHRYGDKPVGVVERIHRFARRTEAEWSWIENDPDVDAVKNIYEQGGYDASVGMRVLESAYDAQRNGLNILRAEVIEFSLTPVPANPGAVALAKALSDERDFGLGDLTAGELRDVLRRAFAPMLAPRAKTHIPGTEALDLDMVSSAEVLAVVRDVLPAIARDAVAVALPAALRAARGRVD
jgi:hypothetical protein